jgi:hypothetical protein
MHGVVEVVDDEPLDEPHDDPCDMPRHVYVRCSRSNRTRGVGKLIPL